MGGADAYEAGRDEDIARARKVLETQDNVEVPDAKLSITPPDLPELIADIRARNETLARIAADRQPSPLVVSPETDHPDIFLSHATNSIRRDTVLLIKNALVEKSYTIFFDSESIRAGENYEEVIKRRLMNSSVVVACWSHESFKSTWCNGEWRLASLKGKLVPLAIDEISFEEIPIVLNGLHYIDFTQFSGAAEEPCFKELLKAIQRYVKA